MADLKALANDLASGSVQVIDLTAPLQCALVADAQK